MNNPQQVTTLSLLFLISHFGGVHDVAKSIGLGNHIEVKLARLDKSDSMKGPQCFAINTDNQVLLERPSIRTGADTLQRK